METNSPEYWEARHQRDDWPRWSSWAMEVPIRNVPQGGEVIIFACGQGMEAIKLLEHRPDIDYILALDVSRTAIKKAEQNLAESDLKEKDKIEFLAMDILNLSGMMTFDYGISIQNLEHWKPKTHPDYLNKMFTCIKPGGTLFLTGVGSTWDLKQTNSGHLITPEGVGEDHPNDLHYCNWTEQSMYDLLRHKKVGAESVTFWSIRNKDRVLAEAHKRG